eukprot:g3424.t1
MMFTTGLRPFGVLPRAGLVQFRRPIPGKLKATEAEEDGETSNSFFAKNRLSGRGYTEEDSAGQQNIFAVQTKSYAQGSEADETTGSAGNTAFGIASAVLAGLVILTGVTTLLTKSAQMAKSEGFTADFKGLSSLTEYKAKFESDLKPAEPVEAPEI